MFDGLVRRLRRRGDVHAVVSVNRGRDGQVTAVSDTRVDPEEAERQAAEVLPERQAMTVMQPPHIGVPIGAIPDDASIMPLPPEEA